MSWSSRKKKECIYCNIYFVVLSEENSFNICVLSQSIVYWISFRIYILLHIKKHYFIRFCCLFLKFLHVLHKTPVLESLFNKVVVLRPPSHDVFSMIFFNASVESLQHIASYYSEPIFLEDLPANAAIFGKLFTLT